MRTSATTLLHGTFSSLDPIDRSTYGCNYLTLNDESTEKRSYGISTVDEHDVYSHLGTPLVKKEDILGVFSGQEGRPALLGDKRRLTLTIAAPSASVDAPAKEPTMRLARRLP